MTVVLLTQGAQGGHVARAFVEETADLIVIPAEDGVEHAVQALAGRTPTAVIAAVPGAAQAVRRLTESLGLPDGLGGLPLDRETQQEVAGSRPTRNHQRVCVDLVSRRGRHASAGVYEHQFVPAGLRQRLSLPADSDAAVAIATQARAELERFGVRDAATCVELEWDGTHARLVEVLPAPLTPAMPADAAFCAFGHSHQHLHAEAILREREFERRLVRPLSAGRMALGLAVLRAGADGKIRGAAGLRTLRRLTGFHSVGRIRPGAAVEPGAIVAVAAFVHPDRASVENSLIVVAEMQEAGGLLAEDYQVIGLAPTAA